MHKTKSQFPDKYVLTSALRNVYQSIQHHVFVYLWNYLYHIQPNSWYNYLYVTEYSQPLFRTALIIIIVIIIIIIMNLFKMLLLYYLDSFNSTWHAGVFVADDRPFFIWTVQQQHTNLHM